MHSDKTQPAWNALQAAGNAAQQQTITQLFEAEPDRIARMTLRAPGMLIDASKQRLPAAAMTALHALAYACDFAAKRAALFAGAPVNPTEGRAVLHAALRADPTDAMATPQLLQEVAVERARMLAFADQVRANKEITDVIHIGIGGSDLGPRLAVQALAASGGPRIHFLSNIDGHALEDVTRLADPARTLISIASKSWTTLETQMNAASVMAWMRASGLPQASVLARCVALTTRPEAAIAQGIAPAQVFRFWDWVGGRYSMWSSIGLPVAIACGSTAFKQMLAGARSMDQHFIDAPAEQNAPLLLALVDAWNLNVLDLRARCVVPYHAHLARLPAYLQQLELESNGKSTTLDGQPVTHATAPLVWGEPGTDAQHSFFQWLHQGTQVCPVDFIFAAKPAHAHADHHLQLAANCLAQSAALMTGKSAAQAMQEMVAAGIGDEEAKALAPHRAFAGNRPSTTIVLDTLDASHFGALIALYEHKTFAASTLWNINAFDQWGVELGKVLARDVHARMSGAGAQSFDASTEFLLGAVKPRDQPR
jgi:glucose-6-phosphate isomerase